VRAPVAADAAGGGDCLERAVVAVGGNGRQTLK